MKLQRLISIAFAIAILASMGLKAQEDYVPAQENLDKIYYDFTVHYPPEPGSHSFEKDGGHISDPYARVYDEMSGR